MSLIGLHGSGDPFIIVLSALLADLLLAGIPGIRGITDGAFAFLRGAASWFGARLNRPHRGARSLAVRGALVVLVFILAAAAVGFGALELVRAVPEGWLLAAVFVALLLRQRRTFDQVRLIGAAVGDGRADIARSGLSRLVSYDTKDLDPHGIARGAVQQSARQVCDGIVAPVFWYLLLDLPGLCVYRAVNALAQAVAHPSPRLADFGRTADAVNRLLTVVPAGIGGVLVAVAAVFVPTANPLRALRTMTRVEGQSAGWFGGWSLGAVAGALGLALGGPIRYDGNPVSFPWIGDGRARATAQDVTRATYLFAVTGLVVMAIVALLRLGVSAV